MNGILLKGCRAEPIASYLKALGVLRLLAEQADPTARGSWRANASVLSTHLDRDSLIDFFLRRYRPTPIITPWNAESGFQKGKPKAEKAIEAIESSTDPRLEPYRRTIEAGRRVYERATSAGWSTGKPKEKALWIEACRSSLPDEALHWFDAVVVLGEDRPDYPPLLGSGGNIGRLDLSTNHMERVRDVLGLEAKSDKQRTDWLEASLFEAATPRLPKGKISQFDPGQAGENKSDPLGEADVSIVNPWDYVLCLEGALLFASSPARRLGMDGRGRSAIPFTVDVTPVGFQTSEEESSGSAEIWTPLWERPITLPELERLIGEGRSQWGRRGRRQARTGLDFVRAAASLGVDRGISAFVRHAVVERFGQSKLIVPVGRVEVRAKPEVSVLRDIDGWVNRIRWARERPAAITAALHRLDAAQYEVAVRGGADRLNTVLGALADLEAAVGVATTFRERRNIRRPVPMLAAESWLRHLDDGTPEFRIAAGFASQRDRRFGRELTQVERARSALATLLRPVELGSAGYGLAWTGRAPTAPGLGVRPLVDVLLDAHRGRVLAALAMRNERGDREGPGLRSAFEEGRWCRVSDVARFVAGELDDERIGRLMRGLLLLDWMSAPKAIEADREEPSPSVPPPAWMLLVPFFLGRTLRVADGLEVELDPEPSWVWMLGAGRVAEVVSRALLRLRMARLEPLVLDAAAVGRSADGKRLAAALLLPLSLSGVRSLLETVAVHRIETERSPTG